MGVVELRDTASAARRVQLDVLRRLGPARRLELACEMSEEARAVTMAGIRARHPGVSDQEATDRLIQILLGPELAERVRASPPGSR